MRPRHTENELIEVAADAMQRALASNEEHWAIRNALRMASKLDFALRGSWTCGEQVGHGPLHGLAKLSEKQRKRIVRELWKDCISHPDDASPKLARVMVGAAMKVLEEWNVLEGP